MRAMTEHLGYRARAAAAAAIVGVLATVLLLFLGSASASSAPSANASRSVTVTIKGFQFKPGTINISRGDRVIWVNRDRAPHTATRGGSFDTGKIRSGRAVAVKFNSRGTYRYICSLHPDMTGKVVVGG
jgi:plastocyanin